VVCLICVGILHAHVAGCVPRRKSRTVEASRPREAEPRQHGFAAATDVVAEGAARPDRAPHRLGAQRDVGGAEEESQARRAAVVDQRFERAQLVFSFRLRFVAHQRRRPGRVVAKNGKTKSNGDRLTVSHLQPGIILSTALRRMTKTTESSKKRCNNIVSYECLWTRRTCGCV